MADCHSKDVRSKNMSAVKGKNTKPEMMIRSLLHKNGFRFRLHDKALPGNPDIILKKYRAVIFVHGCFWHLHGCRKSNIPENNREFWHVKLNANKERDQLNIRELNKLNWRVLVIWECSLKGKMRLSNEELLDKIKSWILSSQIKREL